MESLNYSLKGKDIEYIISEIINNSLNIDNFLQILDNDSNWIEDNIRGEISHSTLAKIVEASYNNKKYSTLLSYIIEIINGDVIDDFVFEKIINHPNKHIKNRVLISLAHKKLKENQLRYLCNTGIAFECYFELAILYYTENKYSLKSLKDFIREFSKSKYSYMREELIFELANYYMASNSEKCEHIKDLMQKSN